MHTTYFAGSDDPARGHRPMLNVVVWPADKPTQAEHLAVQNLLDAIQRVQKVMEDERLPDS